MGFYVKINVYLVCIKMKDNMRRLETYLISSLIIWGLLSACAESSPVTAVVIPTVIAPISQETDAGICDHLLGTLKVETEIDLVGGEARINGCMDPAMAATSATLIYFADCYNNGQVAQCRSPMQTTRDGYFGGTIVDFEADTPISAIEISVNQAGLMEQYICEITSIVGAPEDGPVKVQWACPTTASFGTEQ